MSASKPILAIVGPTASGKTALALETAKDCDGEIISVDSRQVYEELTVGTAKPQGRWKDGVYVVDGIPHHLMDFLDPAESFSAANFAEQAQGKIDEIEQRRKVPILVGGTGFYFRSFLEGLAPMPPANEAVRDELRGLAEQKGRPWLHAELQRVDPEAAKKIPANNIHRVIRALEVFRVTGRPISAWHEEHQAATKPTQRAFKVIGLDPGREELTKRIQRRSEDMVSSGIIEETQALLSKGLPENCPGLSGLGYPQVIQFLKGQLSKAELIQSLVTATRQYAKRQMTWFRNQMDVQWKK